MKFVLQIDFFSKFDSTLLAKLLFYAILTWNAQFTNIFFEAFAF